MAMTPEVVNKIWMFQGTVHWRSRTHIQHAPTLAASNHRMKLTKCDRLLEFSSDRLPRCRIVIGGCRYSGHWFIQFPTAHSHYSRWNGECVVCICIFCILIESPGSRRKLIFSNSINGWIQTTEMELARILVLCLHFRWIYGTRYACRKLQLTHSQSVFHARVLASKRNWKFNGHFNCGLFLFLFSVGCFIIIYFLYFFFFSTKFARFCLVSISFSSLMSACCCLLWVCYDGDDDVGDVGGGVRAGERRRTLWKNPQQYTRRSVTCDVLEYLLPIKWHN